MSQGTRLQVLAQADNVDDKAVPFEEQLINLRRGDIIGVRGFPTRTNPKTKQGGGDYSGELSIGAIEVTLLSPCLHQVTRAATRPASHPLTPCADSR